MTKSPAGGAQAALAAGFLVTGAGTAVLLHSIAWSLPPAVLGLTGYLVFARRALRVWQGPGVPCVHQPPCWGAGCDGSRPVAGSAERELRTSS